MFFHDTVQVAFMHMELLKIEQGASHTGTDHKRQKLVVIPVNDLSL
jgi:hypothetical protein